ncbi:hypothetical protein P171DRAFT_226837 [Karstenula rhodostoma CBS 690.94]|uniref:Uncharacterized protein n=1 Tax=Karstenula rhodostoma CBS 690.94 TaxID=1392251 RepID=A0A9P4UFR8_9PLEO|nr:hypothetical protein P171DRAFT_226837 [Karstenula rhodostoma CBS 690.94]
MHMRATEPPRDRVTRVPATRIVPRKQARRSRGLPLHSSPIRKYQRAFNSAIASVALLQRSNADPRWAYRCQLSRAAQSNCARSCPGVSPSRNGGRGRNI